MSSGFCLRFENVWVGQTIELDYNNSHRIGKVVELGSDWVKVETMNGFKTFSRKKIENLCEVLD